VGVLGAEAPALAVVAHGAAELAELVPALPPAVLLDVAHGQRIGVGLEGLLVGGEPRIVGGDVAGDAAVHPGLPEVGHHGLLDARTPRLQRSPFRVALRHGLGLVEVGDLVRLPLVGELVVEDDPVDHEDQEGSDGECESHGLDLTKG